MIGVGSWEDKQLCCFSFSSQGFEARELQQPGLPTNLSTGHHNLRDLGLQQPAFIICPFSQSWQSRGEVNHPSVHVGVKQNPNCRGWRATPWGCLVRPAQPHLCSSDWTQGWAEPGPEQNEGPEVASVPHTLSPCLYHRETGICGEHFFQNTHPWLLPLRKEGVQRCAVVCGNYGPLMVKPTSSLSLFRMGLELWTQKGLVSQSSSPMDLFGPWWGGKKKKQNGRNVAGRTLREMTYFQVGLAACCRRQLCPGHTGHSAVHAGHTRAQSTLQSQR